MSGNASKQFKETTTVDVTASGTDLFSFPTSSSTPLNVRYIANIGTHLRWGPAGTGTIADQTDAYVPANCVENINIGPNDEIAVVSAAGASTGVAWFTPV